MPSLRALARAFPDHERILAAPAPLAPLLSLAEVTVGADGSTGDPVPAIDRVTDVAEMAPLPSALHGTEVAVNLHGCGPQSHRLLLATRPGRALWFAHPEVPESAGAPRWLPDAHEVVRWCRLLEAYGIPADPTELALRRPPAGVSPWPPGTTVVHPGAASAARRWPARRFAALARAERDRGRAVVVSGGASERSLAEEVARAAGLEASAVVAGHTDLAGLAAGIAHAGRVICGDTGLAHLATAFGTPSLLLFGPTPPSRWGPPPGLGPHRVLWAGRTGDPHAETTDPGLLEISVEEALAELDRLPDGAPAATVPG